MWSTKPLLPATSPTIRLVGVKTELVVISGVNGVGPVPVVVLTIASAPAGKTPPKDPDKDW